MTETLQIIGIPLLLLFLAYAHVVPPALLASGLIRLAFRWHRSWRLLGGAMLLMLPQAMISLGGIGIAEILRYFTVALAVAGSVLFWRAIRGHRGGKIVIEALALTFSLVYVLAGVNWIVG